jgi:hypothetical protein
MDGTSPQFILAILFIIAAIGLSLLERFCPTEQQRERRARARR